MAAPKTCCAFERLALSTIECMGDSPGCNSFPPALQEHDHASTGLRRFSLEKLVNWTML